MGQLEKKYDSATESSADLSELRNVDRMVQALGESLDKSADLNRVSQRVENDLSTATFRPGDSDYIKKLINRANEIQEEITTRDDRDLQRIAANRSREIRGALDRDPINHFQDQVDLNAIGEHCREIGISSAALLQAYYESTNNLTYEQNLAKMALEAGLPINATAEQIKVERVRQRQESEISQWVSRMKLEIPELVEKIRKNPLDYPDRSMGIKRESFREEAISSDEAMSAFTKTVNPEFIKTAVTYSVPLIGWLLFITTAARDDMKLFPPLMIPNPSKPSYQCLKELQLEAQKYGAEIEFSLERKERFSIRWHEPAITAVLKLK